MKEKKLMHMRRADLIEIIYQLQQNEEALRSEVEDLKAQLEDRRIKIERSSSVAEAALSLSGIFEAAQKAADLYLEEIRARAGEIPEGFPGELPEEFREELPEEPPEEFPEELPEEFPEEFPEELPEEFRESEAPLAGEPDLDSEMGEGSDEGSN